MTLQLAVNMMLREASTNSQWLAVRLSAQGALQQCHGQINQL
jgi:hypothetical protein